MTWLLVLGSLLTVLSWAMMTYQVRDTRRVMAWLADPSAHYLGPNRRKHVVAFAGPNRRH